MSEDDSMRPVQDASTLLSKALWARLDLRGVGVHAVSVGTSIQILHQMQPD